MSDKDDKQRILFLGDIEQEEVEGFLKDLFEMASSNKEEICIVINTYGGEIYEMFGIYDAIQYVKSRGIPVRTIGIGKIMSSGVLLLAAGTTRLIGANATIMYHSGSINLGEGRVFEHQTELEEMKRIEDLGDELLALNSNVSFEELQELIRTGSNVYITPKKAVQMGFVDSILPSVATVFSTELPDSKKKKRK